MDSVQTLSLKNEQLVSYRQSLILDKKELEQYLDISNKQRKELEQKLNASIAYISSIESKISLDTIILQDSVIIKNDSIKAFFDYYDDWTSLKGYTQIINSKGYTAIESLDLNVPLTLGLTEDKKIFVTSKNPYVRFTDIQSAAIENSLLTPKKKRFNVGIQAGFGGGFDIITRKGFIGPYIGVGLSYGFNF